MINGLLPVVWCSPFDSSGGILKRDAAEAAHLPPDRNDSSLSSAWAAQTCMGNNLRKKKSQCLILIDKQTPTTLTVSITTGEGRPLVL